MLSRTRKVQLRSKDEARSFLLPFLYCTRTIQSNSPPPVDAQFKQSLHTHARDSQAQRDQSYRQRSSETNFKSEPRPPRIPDIPFERLPPKNDTYTELALDGSTITPNERKAFEKLFNLQRQRSTEEARKEESGRKTKVTRRRRDERQRDVDGAQHEVAATDSGAEFMDADGRRKSGMPAALRAMIEGREKETKDQPQGENKEAAKAIAKAKVQKDSSSEAAQKELRSVSKAMDAAQTDVEVWQILQERVLKRVALTSTTPGAEEGTTSPDIITLTLPTHLTRTFKLLQTSFPTSMLPLSILPTLKRTAHPDLGISTNLYNLHMSLLWKRYNSTRLTAIVDELKAMETSKKCQFDSETLALIQDILVYANRTLRGEYGESVRMLWEMERTRGALREIARFRSKVVTAVEEGAMRAAWEREARREVEVGGAAEIRV